MYSNIRMGFCPIGKFVFSHEDAKNYKQQLEAKMDEMGINYIGIDSVVTDGIVRGHESIDVVIEYLKSQKVDCLFLPHCNFGTESAAGMIAKKMGVPTLLWGPRDKAPLEDGTRLRDSLCGLFASSKILVKLKVPFTYITNCEIYDEDFRQGLDKFLRAANVVKKFKGAKIGVVGNRIDFFWSTIVDESELLRKFDIEILPVDLIRITRATKERAEKKKSEYVSEMRELEKTVDISAMTEQGMINVLSLRDVLYDFAKDNHLSALTIESFMSIIQELGVCVSFAQAQLGDMGIPCVCESDIHGAVSSIIAEAAALDSEPSFFADLTVRHPDNDKGILLWHDSFPLSLKDRKCAAKLGTHWILPNFSTGMCHWRLRDGDITIVRFDGEGGQYKLFAEECRTIPGPFTQNTYVWVELDNWEKFEKKVIYGPYIHHTACIYGKSVEILEEACKYMDGLVFETV